MDVEGRGLVIVSRNQGYFEGSLVDCCREGRGVTCACVRVRHGE